MKVKKWLTISAKGSVRITQGKPGLSWNEVSILLDINLPDGLFNRPRLEAKIDIPEDAVGPETLTSEVIENVKDAIEHNTGLTFSINVIKEENKKEPKHDKI